MRPWYGFAWGWALAVLAASGMPAQAAWNNVFQVCCNHCGTSTPAPVVAGYSGDPCCPAPPTTTCTTRYVQRSYYQPVTSYRTSYYYEPVTTYRTSYYYEPVTSYRYSCYYDPCTCRYQSVAVPTTSYALKSRCCPVTSYLQRTCMTPVTTYQQSFYYEPVTSCCTTSSGGAVASPPPGATTVPPATSETTTPPPAGTMPPPPPGTSESTQPGTNTSDYPRTNRTPDLQNRPVMPRSQDSSYRGYTPKSPAVRFDRIASQGDYNIQGKVVRADQRPRGGAKILLVSVEAKANQHTVKADSNGAFQASVPAGGWLVYSYDEMGRPVFSRRIEVPANSIFSLTVMHR